MLPLSLGSNSISAHTRSHSPCRKGIFSKTKNKTKSSFSLAAAESPVSPPTTKRMHRKKASFFHGSFVLRSKKPESLATLHPWVFTQTPLYRQSPPLEPMGQAPVRMRAQQRDPREHLPGKQEPHVAGGREKPTLHKAQLDEVRHEQFNPRLVPAGCPACLKGRHEVGAR